MAVLELALLRDSSVFHFDGRSPAKLCMAAFDSFESQRREPLSPLLMAALADGVGIEIFQASILNQMEVWRNRNWECQALNRLHRYRQTRVVKYRGLIAVNAAADQYLLETQVWKDKMNQNIIKVLIRDDDEPPKVPLVYPGF